MGNKGDYKGRYCTRPWKWVSLLDNGNIIPCCPPWTNSYNYGNLNKQSPEEIWNGDKAQKFRQSVLDGSYKYCNENSCPLMQNKEESLHTLEDLKREEHLVYEDVVNNRTILDHGPLEVSCDYDRSCNYSCPSCRREVIYIKGKEREDALELQRKYVEGFFKNADKLTVTASGDAFASVVFRRLLQTIDVDDVPNLHNLLILTNGSLFKKYYDTVKLKDKIPKISVSVSIDAACKETYGINRRGGDWDNLLDNLKYIGDLRKADKIFWFGTSFVVQQNNYKEIKNFLLLCEEYNVDNVSLQIYEPDFIRDLRHDDYFDEWASKAVQEKTHPEHDQLQGILTDPFLDPYITLRSNRRIDLDPGEVITELYMGPLMDVRNGKDISQYDSNYKEYQQVLKDNKKERKRVDDDAKRQTGLSLVQRGILKDIWFNEQTYFVKVDCVKTINSADVTRIPTGDIVRWDEDAKEWLKCSKNSYEYTKYQEMV